MWTRAASERHCRPATNALLLALVALLLAGFLVAPSSTADETELRVIPLKHRLADEIVPALRPLLGSGESVSGMDSRLIVRAAPATFTQIERMLASVDVARRNLRISVRRSGEHDAIRQTQEISGDLRSANTRIIVSGGQNTGSGGLIVDRGGPNGSMHLRTEQHVTASRENSEQTITVLDGGRAFLRVGESIPEIQPFLVLVGNRLAVAAGIQYHDVTTGFDVQPQLLGDGVRLAIAPRLAFLSNQGTHSVEFQELSTAVIVKLGEWIDLGRMVASANGVNREILAFRNSQSGEATRLLIRVDVP